MESLKFTVTCSPGLEPVLAEELSNLKLEGVAENPRQGSVRFEGSPEDALTVLLESRIASRVMLEIKSFSAKSSDMLYDQVRRIPWNKYFTPFQSFAVQSSGLSQDIKISFATLKIKDAICDEFKKLAGSRPDVNRQEPDHLISAFFYGGKCTLSIDLGFVEPLHRRGLRVDSDLAPLRENRAAALLRFAGYSGDEVLWDPFCGSGTILLEAAQIATKKAPGLLHDPTKAYRLEKIFPDLIARRRELVGELRKRGRKAPALIIGSDISGGALRSAERNRDGASLTSVIHLQKLDALKVDKKEILYCFNPPWGERLEEEKKAAELLGEFIRHLKFNCAPCKIAAVLATGRVEKSLGLKPKKKLRFQNGPLENIFVYLEVFPPKGAPKN